MSIRTHSYKSVIGQQTLHIGSKWLEEGRLRRLHMASVGTIERCETSYHVPDCTVEWVKPVSLSMGSLRHTPMDQ